MITLEKIKLHLRLDDEEEDQYLTILINAATTYITSITGVKNDADAPATYEIACFLLIGTWFANRESVVAGTISKLPYGLDHLIQSLRPVEGLF